MKGVIAAINPNATVIDLCHSIPPQQILQAAIALHEAIDAFPDGTIHVAVIDPGVGSRRRAIAAEIGPYRFVCPDNGLLTPLLRRFELRRFVELDRPQWWRKDVSRTFHGRDIFAPVAAAWSTGRDLSELGTIQTCPLIEISLPAPCAIAESDPNLKRLQCSILAVDHFGNLITNVTRYDIPRDAESVEVQIAGQCLSGIADCYADRAAGQLVALFGSSERLEISVVNGSAATKLNVAPGAGFTIVWKGQRR
jgi:S-adenosylmethionine hydrolase